MKTMSGLQTKSIHAGRSVDPSTGAVTPPLHTSTTFERDLDGEFSRKFAYIRAATPNRDSLESCITALEGGDETISFGSGMAASLEEIAIEVGGAIGITVSGSVLAGVYSTILVLPNGAVLPPAVREGVDQALVVAGPCRPALHPY